MQRLILSSLTAFCSAFLLFQIQPMIAKVLLPAFGGSSSVWISCMMFFQIALFLGYLAAEKLVRHLTPRWQGLVFTALLLLCLTQVPIIPTQVDLPSKDLPQAVAVLILLTKTIALPFLCLSMTATLIQSWYTLTTGQKPYGLYAVSNLGSFIALFSYPLLVEPWLDVTQQSRFWTVVFVCLLLLIVLHSAKLPHLNKHQSPPPESCEAPVSPSAPVLWSLFAALGVVVLLSITNCICSNIAPVPLLWVIPLALYLLTFIIVFYRDTWRYQRLALFAFLSSVALLAVSLALWLHHITPSTSYMLYALLAVLFSACLVAHGELALAKPTNPRNLPIFYRCIALGGAMGGIFVGVIAPLIYRNQTEVVIGILGVPLCGIAAKQLIGRAEKFGVTPIVVGALLLIAVSVPLERLVTEPSLLFIHRNFYGTLSVRTARSTDHNGKESLQRVFAHGITVHGVQFLDPEKELMPTAYFGPNSGAGRVLHPKDSNPRTVAIVGLGIGTLAAYARPQDTFHFIELDPDVVLVASNYFSFLTKSDATIALHVGDGRNTLTSFPPCSLDVIILDAFSGDAIPTHLLTREALELYFSRLRVDGVLVVHTSNHHLDLNSVVQATAASLKLPNAIIVDSGDPSNGTSLSTYAVISKNRNSLSANSEELTIPQNTDTKFIWRDSYSNLWSVLR